MNGSDDRRRGRSRWDYVVDVLDSYSTWVGLGAVVIASIFAFVVATRGVPGVPRYWRVFLVAAVATAALGYPAVVKILRYLFDPPRRFLVQPGVSADEGGIWRLSPSKFEDLSVKGGELYEWPGTKFPTYEVEYYDEDMNLCQATWRGSASDGEMIQNQEKIDECRDFLEQKAKERDVLMTRCETLLREAILENSRLLIEEYNRASIVDVSAWSSKIDSVLDEASLTDDLQDISQQRTDPETESEPESINQPTRTPQAAADGGQEVDDDV